MSILMVHCGGIGDFLITAPLFHRYAAGKPWDVAGDLERGQLAVAARWARRALSLNSLDFSSIYTTPTVRLREHLLDYDEVLVWLGDDPESEARCREAGLPHVRFLPALPPADWSRHAAEFYAAQLGLPDADPLPIRLRGMPRPREKKQRDWMMIHPGSGSPKKNWPIANFVALSEALRARGQRVSWISGPAEGRLPATVGSHVLRRASLVRRAGGLAGAALYVGNDSGITHLAASVGCPTIAIFLNSNPDVWRPRGERVFIVDGNDPMALEKVVATAEQILADTAKQKGD